ncbi:response regulator [Pirellulales bacterium]|nr:response regulator [Pirellulales bacterium]
MSQRQGAVYVVDDDDAIRRSVRALLSTMRVDIFDYPSAEAFLDDYDGRRPACMVTDVRMSGMSGLELQERLRELGHDIAIIVITAHANTPMAVRAMRSGALTVLEKPCDEDALYNAVRKGLASDEEAFGDQHLRGAIALRLETLTPKERSVFDLIVQGEANKNVARKLALSVRTVETYRQRVFEKMEADSLAALVRMSVSAAEKK